MKNFWNHVKGTKSTKKTHFLICTLFAIMPHTCETLHTVSCSRHFKVKNTISCNHWENTSFQYAKQTSSTRKHSPRTHYYISLHPYTVHTHARAHTLTHIHTHTHTHAHTH